MSQFIYTKAMTIAKWTSTDKYRDNYDRIFGKKEDLTDAGSDQAGQDIQHQGEPSCATCRCSDSVGGNCFGGGCDDACCADDGADTSSET